MQAELLVLRLIHIVGGVLWVGSFFFTTFFLLPTLKELGPTSGQVMGGLQRRGLMVVLPTLAILTILSGIRLMMITSGNFSAEYFARLGGQMYAASGVAAVVAFLIGVIVSRPAAMRMGKLSQMTASAETDRAMLAGEMQKLQRRAAVSGVFVAALLLFAAAGMAVARYL